MKHIEVDASQFSRPCRVAGALLFDASFNDELKAVLTGTSDPGAHRAGGPMVSPAARLRRFLLDFRDDGEGSAPARRVFADAHDLESLDSADWGEVLEVIDAVRAMELQGVPARAAYLQVGAFQTLA